MVSEALFIATVSVLLVVIGWIVIVLFKQKEKIANNEANNQILEKRHNDLVLEVATMIRDVNERMNDQESDNSATRRVLHELQITLTKLDTTFTHFNKSIDKLTDDLSNQREIIDDLRFKIAK